MKNILFFFFFLLFSVSAYSQSGNGAIRGNIIDIKHKPPGSVNIRVLKDNVMVTEIQTTADGKFNINSVKPGTYKVSVEDPAGNYIPFTEDNVVVSPDRITFLDDIILLKPGEELKGRDKRKRQQK